MKRAWVLLFAGCAGAACLSACSSVDPATRDRLAALEAEIVTLRGELADLKKAAGPKSDAVPASNVVRANRIELVDEGGQTRVQIVADRGGQGGSSRDGAGVRIFNERGEPAAWIGSSENAGAVRLSRGRSLFWEARPYHVGPPP